MEGERKKTSKYKGCREIEKEGRRDGEEGGKRTVSFVFVYFPFDQFDDLKLLISGEE